MSRPLLLMPTLVVLTSPCVRGHEMASTAWHGLRRCRVIALGRESIMPTSSRSARGPIALDPRSSRPRCSCPSA